MQGAMFTKTFRLFSILGFRISIDLTWFFLAGLVVWSLGAGFFPDVLPGIDPVTSYTIAVFAALGMFASIIFHELAHAIVARYYKIKIAGITLFIFGGVAELEDEPPTAKSEFLVAVAGPVSSYLLALIFYLLSELMPQGARPEIFALLSYLSLINIVLATFNLIPAFPLDGGRMLRAALWWIRGNLRWATRIAAILGAALGVGLMAFGVYNGFQGSSVGGMWQILIGFFIFNAAGNAQRQMEVMEILRGVTVGQLMKAPLPTIPAHISVDQLAGHPDLAGQTIFLPVTENGQVIGLVQPSALEKIPVENRRVMPVRDAASPLKEAEIFQTEQTAIGALGQLRRARGHQGFVMSNGEISGWIAARDIFNYIDHNSAARKAEKA